MKPIRLLPLLLAAFALAGCQTIRAHNPFRARPPQYQAAQQEQPLAMPPGVNAPSTADALAIPVASSTPAIGAKEAVGDAPPPLPTLAELTGTARQNLNLVDTPDSAYHRVGLALERGGTGKVTGHDDATRSYQVTVQVPDTVRKRGFFSRLFHRKQNDFRDALVAVHVTAAANDGSSIEVSGDPAAVERIAAELRQRLL